MATTTNNSDCIRICVGWNLHGFHSQSSCPSDRFGFTSSSTKARRRRMYHTSTATLLQGRRSHQIQQHKGHDTTTAKSTRLPLCLHAGTYVLINISDLQKREGVQSTDKSPWGLQVGKFAATEEAATTKQKHKCCNVRAFVIAVVFHSLRQS